MNIKPVIYENLTTQERIIATLEANARNDEEEKAKLVRTCPKKSYLLTDPAYTNMMEALHDIALVVESDMRGCALNFFMLMWNFDNAKYPEDNSEERLLDLAINQLREMISIQRVWHEFLHEEGIPLETAQSAFGEIEHFGIEWSLGLSEEMEIKPYEETVKRYKDLLAGLHQKNIRMTVRTTKPATGLIYRGKVNSLYRWTQIWGLTTQEEEPQRLLP